MKRLQGDDEGSIKKVKSIPAPSPFSGKPNFPSSSLSASGSSSRLHGTPGDGDTEEELGADIGS